MATRREFLHAGLAVSARTLANPLPDALRMGSGAPFVMGATAVSDGDLEPLVSWIIAPRERAQEIRVASL